MLRELDVADTGVGIRRTGCTPLVDLMDGRLRASSEVGVGSTFTFGVPLGTTLRC